MSSNYLPESFTSLVGVGLLVWQMILYTLGRPADPLIMGPATTLILGGGISLGYKIVKRQ